MALRQAALNGDVQAMMYWLSRRCPDFAQSAIDRELADDGEDDSGGPTQIYITRADAPDQPEEPSDVG